MKGFKLSCLCCIFTFVVVAFAGEVTDTLQNGLNSYDGCEDSYIYSQSTSSNYGDETTMDLQCRRVSAG